MTTLRHFASALALVLIALASGARAQTPAPEAPAPQESLAPTGSGTAGRIPKWTTSTNLSNSVITENTGRIGVNISVPSARLHVFGATPAPKATDGTDATPLLLTTGGKGGATTVAGLTAGKGADILLTGGTGGDAAAGSQAGRGGNIVLRPGAPGAGGYENEPGNVLLAPNAEGRVGIGTPSPLYKLHVNGGSSYAVYGVSSNTGVFGSSAGGVGVLGISSSGFGVYGSSATGYAGHFEGKVKVMGNLQVGSCSGCTIAPSDRALKANISTVAPRSILNKLASIPLQTWSYKSDGSAVRHLGPMAQDFRAAFNLGADDKHIDMIDASGVTMASVQALYQLMKERDEQVQQMMLEKDRQIEALTRKVERQGRHSEQLQAQLNQVRRSVRGRRAARR